MTALLKNGIKLATFVVYSNIWVALSVAALTWVSQHFFKFYNLNYVAFTFFATLAFYNYARFFESESASIEKSPVTLWHIHNKKTMWFITLLSGVASAWFLFELHYNIWWIIALCAVVALLYPIPYVAGRWSGLRYIPGFKLFTIAMIWCVVTAVIPALQAQLYGTTLAWIHIFQRFIFITIITIPFDIRDFKTDLPKIETVPLRFGVKNAQLIILIMGLLIEASVLLQYFENHISGWHFWAQFLGIELAVILSYRSYPVKPDLYYAFAIEGTPIFMFLLVYFFQYF